MEGPSGCNTSLGSCRYLCALEWGPRLAHRQIHRNFSSCKMGRTSRCRSNLFCDEDIDPMNS